MIGISEAVIGLITTLFLFQKFESRVLIIHHAPVFIDPDCINIIALKNYYTPK